MDKNGADEGFWNLISPMLPNKARKDTKQGENEDFFCESGQPRPFPYVHTVCIIFKTPCLKYFEHGVLNIM